MEVNNIKQLLIYIFGAAILVACNGVIIVGPKEAYFSLISFFISLFLALTLVVCKVIKLRKRFWVASYIELILPLPAYFSVFLINLVRSSFPQWYFTVVLTVMYPAAIVLPFVHHKLAKKISDEIRTPSTWFGKLILFGILLIAPSAGLTGVMLSRASRSIGNGVIGYSIVSLLFHTLFVLYEVDFAYLGWKIVIRKNK